MRLNVIKFAKIKEADIIIDGITVIAGENNTGKSTVGKILFSLFNVLSDIEDRIFSERLKEIETTNKKILQSYINASEFSRSTIARQAINISHRINIGLREILEEEGALAVTDEVIYDFVEKTLERRGNAYYSFDFTEVKSAADEITRNVREILRLPEEDIALEAISGYFKNVFHAQINPLEVEKNSEAIINLEIKGKNNELHFMNNLCKKFAGEITINQQAIYIDYPFVIDELSKYNDLDPMNELLKNTLRHYPKEDVLDGIIESLRAKEKLNDVYTALQSVVDGEIVFNQNEEYYLKNEDCGEPVSFYNLSTGMKSFVIIKMLLEKGGLKERDVLILDEPEIHLHPQWQIAYAELIVLLQKQFELSVVVTTHSPYFVDAINLFSCKHGSADKVNYYLSALCDDGAVINRVTENINLIYEKMASPIQMLDTLRYELNNN